MFLRAMKDDEYDILTKVYLKYRDAIKNDENIDENSKSTILMGMAIAGMTHSIISLKLLKYMDENKIFGSEEIYALDEENIPEGVYRYFLIDNPELAETKVSNVGEKYPGVLSIFGTIIDKEPGCEFYYGDLELCHIKMSINDMTVVIDHHFAEEDELTDPKAKEMWDLLSDITSEAMSEVYKTYFNKEDEKEND